MHAVVKKDNVNRRAVACCSKEEDVVNKSSFEKKELKINKRSFECGVEEHAGNKKISLVVIISASVCCGGPLLPVLQIFIFAQRSEAEGTTTMIVSMNTVGITNARSRTPFLSKKERQKETKKQRKKGRKEGRKEGGKEGREERKKQRKKERKKDRKTER